jgi:glucokinase
MRLVIDLGGTNARLALQAGSGAALTHLATHACSGFSDLQALIEHYLAADGDGARPAQCAIGIASPIQGDEVVMTNLAWRFSQRALQAALGLERLVVINDFTALALALPLLEEAELMQVGAGEPAAGRAWGLIGPGTGLGVGGLVPGPDGRLGAISGEGGHVTLAGADAHEDAVLAAVRAEFGHASAERVLSGPGLVNLYRAVSQVAGRRAQALTPADVSRAALDGSDADCAAAVAMFFGLLGSAAGNLALTLGAQRGVFIGGGIVPAMGDAILRSDFRARFEAKGRYAGYLACIPTWVIQANTPPALRGAAQALA